MPGIKEVIKIGGVEIRFLMDGDDTGGRLSVFEFIVAPGARVPAAHYHDAVDEALYGLEGTLTFTVEGQDHQIGPGNSCFVARGAVHRFVNNGSEATRTLAVLTPASIGPQYFRDIAALLGSGGPPDPAKLAEVMRAHGLIAAP